MQGVFKCTPCFFLSLNWLQGGNCINFLAYFILPHSLSVYNLLSSAVPGFLHENLLEQ